jgi:hypothetical protein
VKPGPKPKHDYKALYLEFCAIRANSGITEKAYCAERGLNPTYTSSRFADLKREAEIAIFKRKNTEILVKAQQNVENALGDEGLPAEFQAKYSLETYKAVADREGLSPQANIINIQNSANAQAAAVIVPLFAGSSEDEDDFRKLMGGE